MSGTTGAILVFLVALGLAAYPLILYPLLVVCVARLRPRPWREGDVGDPAIHIVTVRDEEARIRAKLDNCLALAPPRGGLRTLVADDGSRDGTRAIVEEYADRGVVWIGCPRRGKERAQLEAIRRTVEPIVVLSDASAILEHDAVVELLRPFADPQIGAVSGTDRLPVGTGRTGEDLYVGYEMALRRAESIAGSLVGLSGCFFGVRRALAERLLDDVPSDMGAALVAIRSGQRAVAQESARCTYSATPAVGREFARKRRTALRGLRGLWAYRAALAWRRPLRSWQVLSHKWLRFAMPLFASVAGAALVGAAVGGAAWAAILLAGSSLVLAAGVVSLVIPRLRRLTAFRALAFLLVSMAAVVTAWSDLLRGQTQVQWTPTRRPEERR